ncbi:MAG: glycosyltransferase family 2 protein, partial [Candidatus Andersenbacteria bacterium]
MNYSVVVPAHNEEESMKPLYEATKKVFDQMGGGWELIVIDDGSTDGTYKAISGIADMDSHVKVIKLRRSFGQTAGWSAGFSAATGDIVVVMDADMQNDPEDIPAMIQKLHTDNLDVVSGWRQNRKDKSVLK